MEESKVNLLKHHDSNLKNTRPRSYSVERTEREGINIKYTYSLTLNDLYKIIEEIYKFYNTKEYHSEYKHYQIKFQDGCHVNKTLHLIAYETKNSSSNSKLQFGDIDFERMITLKKLEKNENKINNIFDNFGSVHLSKVLVSKAFKNVDKNREKKEFKDVGIQCCEVFYKHSKSNGYQVSEYIEPSNINNNLHPNNMATCVPTKFLYNSHWDYNAPYDTSHIPYAYESQNHIDSTSFYYSGLSRIHPLHVSHYPNVSTSHDVSYFTSTMTTPNLNDHHYSNVQYPYTYNNSNMPSNLLYSNSSDGSRNFSKTTDSSFDRHRMADIAKSKKQNPLSQNKCLTHKQHTCYAKGIRINKTHNAEKKKVSELAFKNSSKSASYQSGSCSTIKETEKCEIISESKLEPDESHIPYTTLNKEEILETDVLLTTDNNRQEDNKIVNIPAEILSPADVVSQIKDSDSTNNVIFGVSVSTVEKINEEVNQESNAMCINNSIESVYQKSLFDVNMITQVNKINSDLSKNDSLRNAESSNDREEEFDLVNSIPSWSSICSSTSNIMSDTKTLKPFISNINDFPELIRSEISDESDKFGTSLYSNSSISGTSSLSENSQKKFFSESNLLYSKSIMSNNDKNVLKLTNYKNNKLNKKIQLKNHLDQANKLHERRPSYIRSAIIPNKSLTPRHNKKKHVVDKDGWETVKGRWRDNDKYVKPNQKENISDKPFSRFRLTYEFINDKNASSSDETKDDKSNRYESDNEEQTICEEVIRKNRELQEEEILLKQEIKVLESADYELDWNIEMEADNENPPECLNVRDLHDQYRMLLENVACLEQQEINNFKLILSSDPTDSIFQSLSGSLEQFEEFVVRYPGKAKELHKKLLPQSKRLISKEEAQARQLKAQEHRDKLKNEKAAKIRDLLQKVEEVRNARQHLIEEQKIRIELKLKKAEQNRNLHLSEIRRKAHDEEEKLKEIAFINELEAQNRRHDSLALRQEQEERLQIIIEERQKKIGQKAAKEAAVSERKRALEEERKKKLETLKQKRREKEEIIDRKHQEREKERMVLAQEKAREREERLLARQAAQLAEVEELQKKIQIKQENSARRHEESIQQIKQKAVETGLRAIQEPKKGKKNRKRNQKTQSHVSETQSDQGINLNTKYYRKKCNVLRNKLNVICLKFLENFKEFETKIHENRSLGFYIQSLQKLIRSDNSYIVNKLDLIEKYVNEIDKHTKDTQKHRTVFREAGGFIVISEIIKSENIINDKILFNKLLIKICKILKNMCENCQENCNFVILSNVIITLFDALLNLTTKCLEGEKVLHLIEGMLQTINIIFASIQVENIDIEENKELNCHICNVISYASYSGALLKLNNIIRNATLSGSKFNTVTLIPFIVKLLRNIQKFCKVQKSSEFLDLIQKTEILGLVYLLYSCLQESPNILPCFIANIIIFLNDIAIYDTALFQKTLNAESTSVQFRFISSFLLSYCTTNKGMGEIMTNIVKLIGFFAVSNYNNQILLQSGQTPTVLQQLVSLPIDFFVMRSLKNILFPTIIACCWNNSTNTTIVENEMSYDTLTEYMKSSDAKNSILLKKLLT